MKRFWALVLLLLTFPFFSTLASSDEAGRIHFINVGEGDSILLEIEGKSALIDTGNLISGPRLVKYLKGKGIEKLNYLILTHPHPDHIGGVFFILPALKVEKIYDNGQELDGVRKTCAIYRWYEDLVRKRKNYAVLISGDSLTLGSLTLEVLWPPRAPTSSDFNVFSLVIMVKGGGFSCLLTGDLTAPGERELLIREVNLKADVLKVGHHGAEDATSQEFLEAVSPGIAVISVDKDNFWGYPSARALERLKKAGVKVYRTDREGDIVLSIPVAESWE
ncbi:MAG TPA: MBL fold metallo-hydrolase [Candidatus Scalindua sp.]|nr:MBL fold metallo-hydrolase [Candidatus Scalindua sp.]